MYPWDHRLILASKGGCSFFGKTLTSRGESDDQEVVHEPCARSMGHIQLFVGKEVRSLLKILLCQESEIATETW